ncbi:MAG TPA: hypothetical protein VM141_04365 [Planctomycetota bacterium]|nr:hypothetical protein [Planctomycetota bacterium]
MKRKPESESEMLVKLSENIEKLLTAAERLSSAADYSRRQIDRLAQLVNRVEDILQRTSRPGISIEGDDRCDKGRPVNIDPDDAEQLDDCEPNLGFGHFVEFSSYEELKKFQKLPPISGDDIELCNFDEVIRQLLSDHGQA